MWICAELLAVLRLSGHHGKFCEWGRNWNQSVQRQAAAPLPSTCLQNVPVPPHNRLSFQYWGVASLSAFSKGDSDIFEYGYRLDRSITPSYSVQEERPENAPITAEFSLCKTDLGTAEGTLPWIWWASVQATWALSHCGCFTKWGGWLVFPLPSCSVACAYIFEMGTHVWKRKNTGYLARRFKRSIKKSGRFNKPLV